MTVSHHAVPVHVPSLAAALGTLRARGLRISSARRLVLEALFAAQGPSARRRSRAGSTGACPRPTSPPSTATSTPSRRSAWCGTCTSATAPGSTRCPDAIAAASRRASAAGATCTLRGGALAAVEGAVRAACGFACDFDHFPLVGCCPECAAER